MSITLFPDQQEALNVVLSAYQKQPIGGRALVVAPTAWGKTTWFSTLARVLKGKNILIIAHRDELLNQARVELQQADPTSIIGKVGSGAYEWGAPLTVAGVDTISQEQHLKNLHRFGYDIVIVDECHHSPSPKYMKVLQVLKDAFHLGVTATPDRLDGKQLDPIFGKPVFSMNIIEAIQHKRLSDVRAIAIKTETSLDDIHSSRNSDGEIDFNQLELANAVDTPARNRRVVEAYLEHAKGRRAICFGVSVAHAQHMADTFNETGVPSAIVTGNTTLEERKKLYDALRVGDLKILTNVLVLTEGFNVPVISCVIMARPTQSRALYTQCIGRGMRLAPGKHDCLILDLTDNTSRLRLTPQNLRQAINIQTKDNELITEAVEREEDEKAEREAAEKRALIRKLNERRKEDKQVDLFGLPEWQEREGGMFVLEVGLQKHRIALVPKGDSSWTQLYDVWARLAPTFEAQRWLSAQPLDYCQQYAEKKARMLAESSKNAVLVDRNAAWRSKPIDPESGQAGMLRMYRIPFGEGTAIETKGQASDAIDERKRQIEERKRKKAERAEARAQRNEVSA